MEDSWPTSKRQRIFWFIYSNIYIYIYIGQLDKLPFLLIWGAKRNISFLWLPFIDPGPENAELLTLLVRMGVHPKVFPDRMHSSVSNLVQHGKFHWEESAKKRKTGQHLNVYLRDCPRAEECPHEEKSLSACKLIKPKGKMRRYELKVSISLKQIGVEIQFLIYVPQDKDLFQMLRGETGW